MVYQNDPDCLPIIQSSGCFVRSCGILAESVAAKHLTAEQINTVWKLAQSKGFIGNEPLKSCGIRPYATYGAPCKGCDVYNKCRYNNVVRSDSIINLFLKQLECPGKFTEVGVGTGKGVQFYTWVPSSMKSKKYAITKAKQNGPQGVHFVAEINGVKTDPYDPEINLIDRIHTIYYNYEV